jgi:hypothetical protein
MVLRVSEMTKKIEYKGVSNQLLCKLGWVMTKSKCNNSRNSELRLCPEDKLLKLRLDLLALRRDLAGFIAQVFYSYNSVWVERCSQII